LTQPPFKPPHWPTVTPRIVTRDPAALVQFIQQVFDATGEYCSDRPTVLSIGESLLMVSNAPDRKLATAFLYVYVTDADAAYSRAIDAGAQSIERPTNLPYGDRRAMVKDRWGNVWQIATFGHSAHP
jgi:PhnB protein